MIPAPVPQALVGAASRLISTLVRASKTCVEKSLDAAGVSACGTCR